MINYIIHQFYILIYLGESKIDFWFKINQYWQMVLKSSLFVYILNALGFWFHTNQSFVNAVFLAIFGCMISSFFAYRKTKNFHFSTWILKTLKMIAVMLLVYPMMDQIANIVTVDLIKQPIIITLQVATAIYPASKCLKNCYVLSNGKFPPEWLMNKVYNFEKTGSLKDFLKNNRDE